jgi:hypothetical protein
MNISRMENINGNRPRFADEIRARHESIDTEQGKEQELSSDVRCYPGTFDETDP